MTKLTLKYAKTFTIANFKRYDFSLLDLSNPSSTYFDFEFYPMVVGWLDLVDNLASSDSTAGFKVVQIYRKNDSIDQSKNFTISNKCFCIQFKVYWSFYLS